jgi:hypothetical protein
MPRFGLIIAWIMTLLLMNDRPASVALGKPVARVTALTVEVQQKDEKAIVVRFKNISDAPLIVFRPLDGSEHGIQWPHYQFTVIDETGVELPMPPRMCGISGLWADKKWPEDYQLVIPAKGVLEVPAHILQIPHEGGRYKVRFAYDYPRSAGTEKGGPAAAWGPRPFPEGTWFGRVESAETEVNVTKL